MSPRRWAEGGDVTVRWCDGVWTMYYQSSEWLEVLTGPRTDLALLRQMWAPRTVVDATPPPAVPERWWTAVAVGVDAEVRCAHHHGTKAAAWVCAESMRMRGCHRGAWPDARTVYGVERVP